MPARVQRREFLIPREDGVVLHGVMTFRDSPRAVLFVAHGLGEHLGRYEELFYLLSSFGIFCCGVDHRGHGRSSGQRGHISRFSEYLEDFFKLYEHPEIPGDLPWFQWGHSMGGLIAIHLMLRANERFPGKFKGLILSAPLLKIAAEVPAWKAKLGELASRYLPRLSMDNGLDPRALSHDPKVVEEYIGDPLVHRRVTARWYTEILAALEEAQARASELTLPLLVFHGTEDRLTGIEGTEAFLRKVSTTPTYHRMEGYYHEIFNEDQERRIQAYLLLFRWFTEHFPYWEKEGVPPLS